MRSVLITILVLHGLATLELGAVPVGVIHNVSLTVLNTNTTRINGTCEQCVCSLLVGSAFFALNCFHDNRTCNLYSASNKNKPFSLITSGNVSLYFLSIPTYSPPYVATANYLWSFDSTFRDTSSTFNGTPVNSPTFFSSTITGYGSSLSLSATLTQAVSIDQPYLQLYNQSWTFEAWIRLASITSGVDYPILQQRDSFAADKTLHLVVRYGKLYLGFYGDDLLGVANLTVSRWYHTAFVYDAVTRNQSIYLDGVLDASRIADHSYLGVSGALSIGVTYWSGYAYFFDGLIDQLSFTNRTKTSDEILRDATLTLSFSFDGNSTFDEGPLSISGSLVGSTSFVSGRRGQALQISNVSDSYFTVQGLVLLGRDNQPYSFSIWIKPTVVRASTIIHISSLPDGTGWCLPILGLSNASRLITTSWNGIVVKVTGPIIPANSWTHVVSTYSLNNGLRLYANGSLYNVSSAFSFLGSSTPNYLFVGSSRAATNFAWSSDITGQYSGAVDDLQVYSRELTASEINALAAL